MSDESGNASAFCCPMVDEDKGAIYSIFRTVVAIVYIGIAEYTVGILYSKPSKTDKKTRWTDKPSWVNKGMINSDLTAAENASRILNDKYGRGRGFYYVFSRYYKSEIERWINAGDTAILRDYFGGVSYEKKTNY